MFATFALLVGGRKLCDSLNYSRPAGYAALSRTSKSPNRPAVTGRTPRHNVPNKTTDRWAWSSHTLRREHAFFDPGRPCGSGAGAPGLARACRGGGRDGHRLAPAPRAASVPVFGTGAGGIFCSRAAVGDALFPVRKRATETVALGQKVAV